MRFVLSNCAIAITGLTILASHGMAAEKSVPLDKLPQVVSDAVKKMYPTAKVIKATSEEEEGDEELEFEVTLSLDGKKIDVCVEEDGEVESAETELPLADLPKKVKKSLKQRFADWKAASAEAVYEVEDGEQELEYYEVQLKSTDGKNKEVKLKPSGKVVQNDNEHEDDED